MARQSNDEWFTFEGNIEASTPKAVLFIGTMWNEPIWLPRSQIQIIEVNDTNGDATIRIKEWLVDKNDLEGAI